MLTYRLLLSSLPIVPHFSSPCLHAPMTAFGRIKGLVGGGGEGNVIYSYSQVIGTVCLHSLYCYWKDEKSVLRSLHELSVVRKNKENYGRPATTNLIP